MNVLVTAGNTQSPIDRVRVITNVFSGRTGTGIALEAQRRGHQVTLLTSHPELVPMAPARPQLTLVPYRTFADLHESMADLVASQRFEVLIHAAAVSDYELEGAYAPVNGTMTQIDIADTKLKSSYPELWLRLAPTPKLADRVRVPWGFRGTFVKFKLEVGATDDALREIATRARLQSDADLIVANTLDGKERSAWMGDRYGNWEGVERAQLAARLLERVESLPSRSSA